MTRHDAEGQPTRFGNNLGKAAEKHGLSVLKGNPNMNASSESIQNRHRGARLRLLWMRFHHKSCRQRYIAGIM